MRILALTSLVLALATTGAAASATCDPTPMPLCIETTPQVAFDDLQLRLLKEENSQTHRSLGDLYAGANAFHDPEKARHHWRAAFELGDGWAGVALAKSFADEAGDLDGAILMMEEAAQSSQDVRKWADKSVGDLYVRRAGSGDDLMASQAYARATALGNPWATLPLARSTVRRDAAGIDVASLADAIRAGIETTPDFAAAGHVALATLAFDNGEDETAMAALRMAASLDGDTAASARVDLGRRLLAASSGRSEGIELLQAAASSGSTAAALALADHRAAEVVTAKQRRAVIEAYENIAVQDSGFEAVAWARIGDVLSASDRKTDHAEAIGWYEKSATVGNGWANFRLARAYLSGKGVARSAATARSYSQQAFEGGAVVPGVAGLFALHGTGQALEGSDLVEIVRLALDVAPAATVADAITWSSANAQVAFVQQVWKDAGLYSGEVDGVAGSLTLAARRVACETATVEACRDGLLPVELIRAVVGDLHSVTAQAPAAVAGRG